MQLAKVKVDSLKLSLYWIATSTLEPSTARSM